MLCHVTFVCIYFVTSHDTIALLFLNANSFERGKLARVKTEPAGSQNSGGGPGGEGVKIVKEITSFGITSTQV